MKQHCFSHRFSLFAGLVGLLICVVTLTAPTALEWAGAATSGVATTTYKLDGGAVTAYASPFVVTGDGTHTVLVTTTEQSVYTLRRESIPEASAMLGTFLLIALAMLPKQELPPIALAFSCALVVTGMLTSFVVLRWLGAQRPPARLLCLPSETFAAADAIEDEVLRLLAGEARPAGLEDPLDTLVDP